MGRPPDDQGNLLPPSRLSLSVHGARPGRPAVAALPLVDLVSIGDLGRLYDFGASHPLRPERVLLTYDTIRALGLADLGHVSEVDARVATDVEIEAAHDPEFVRTVKGIDTGEIGQRSAFEFGLGTPDDPIFPNMHKASAAVCGASLTATERVLQGTASYAFNPAGGLHHARRREASGFCIYNDPAVAIAKALAESPSERVLYLDVDVHHGDGVQWIFYDEPRVLTLSLHQSGRYLYPGTGFEDETGAERALGTAANLPLLPLTGEADYLWALEQLLFKLGAAFRPTLLVAQLGADTHWGDPLANLGLTMRAYQPMASLIHEAARTLCGDRWVATGGGGYQYDTIVPRVWTMHFAEMCNAADTIPTEWLNDRPSDEVSRPNREQVRRSVEEVLGSCLPRLEALSV